MAVDAPEKPPVPIADTPAKVAGSAAARMDGRTKAARRRAELVATLAEAIGGWGALSRQMKMRVEAAAEGQQIAELVRARFLAGEGGTADDCVRASRAAAAAVKALGISDRPPKPVATTLEAYLAGKAGATS